MLFATIYMADMTPYLLDKDFYRICEPLECPSIQPSLRILLGFPEFLISRLPLENKQIQLQWNCTLTTIFEFLLNHDFPSF